MPGRPIEITDLPSVSDSRGSFIKIFHTSHSALQAFKPQQVNLVRSKKAVLRGLHYQTGQYAEAKFFRALHGSIQLVCFCIDPAAADYKQGFSFVLSGPATGILVPRGYATGYLCLSEQAEVLYLSDNRYVLIAEKGIRWNDPALSVTWQSGKPLLSEKDQNWPDFDPD